MAGSKKLPDEGGIRLWPTDQVFGPGDLVRSRCEGCGQVWGVHRDLSGFRLRCQCGGWVEVPWPSPGAVVANAVQAPPPEETEAPLEPIGSLVRLPQRPEGEVYDEPVATSIPLAEGELRFAGVKTRARWTNRGVIELVGILAAYWVPAAIAWGTLGGSGFGNALPVLTLGSSILVLLICAASGRYSFGGLRWPGGRYLVEALGAVIVFTTMALLWMGLLPGRGIWQSELDSILRDLGTPLLLLSMALCPGIFEELAFRGLLQGRFAALFGRNQAILLTGAAFALAHGVSGGFPILLLIGTYLCWIRARSDSLLPCMVLHTGYNAALILMAA